MTNYDINIDYKSKGHMHCDMYMPHYLRKEAELNIIVYIYMFLVGIVFGSFYTLAVYRIPLKQDITHTRSYCPNCNHKLHFLDLIPVLSYIFLGGKCRYCKQKIRPRYLILEVLSGLTFLVYAYFLDIDLLNPDQLKIITLVFGVLFFSTVFITVGIFKEYRKIQRSVFNFGIIVEIIYMIYLYILNTSIYRYIIYIPLLIMMLILNNFKTNEKLKTIFFTGFFVVGMLEIVHIII